MQRLRKHHVAVLLLSADNDCVLPLLTLLNDGSQDDVVGLFKQYVGMPLSNGLSDYKPADLVPGRSKEAKCHVQRVCARITATVRNILATPEHVCALSNLTHRELTLPYNDRSSWSLQLWGTLQDCMLDAKSILFGLLHNGCLLYTSDAADE